MTMESTSPLTSELLSRAAMGAEDDTLRQGLLRFEAAAQQVDKDQSEIIHQQWRLFCDQLATLSSKNISIRSEIKDLYRMANQEEAERRASVEGMQVALRASEERIFGMLEDLCRNQVSGMALEMERAQRIGACKKITDMIEAEKSDRLGACGELASEVNSLRNMLEESLHQQSSMKNELQNFRNELKKGDENRLDAVKQELDKARAEREEIAHLTEAMAKTLSQDYTSLVEKRISQTEAFARNLLQDEAKARAAGVTELGNKLQSDLERMAADLERESAARTAGDKNAVQEVTSVTADLQQQLEQEKKVRIAGEEEMRKFLTEGLEKAGSERPDIPSMVDSIEAKITQMCRSMLDDEVKFRAQGDEELMKKLKENQELMKNLQDDLDKAGRKRSEVTDIVSQADAALRVAMEEKLGQSSKALRAEIDQVLNEALAVLKGEVSALSGKKDALDTITREMRIKVEEDKQRTDREWMLIHKSIQDHKAQYEEHKEAREAAHSNLQMDMENLWKNEIAQLKFDQDLTAQKLQVDYDTLCQQQEEFAAAVVWKEEMRRVWEAIDSHTHNLDVKDFEHTHTVEEPAKNPIRRDMVREVPRIQPPQPPQVQITAAGYQRYQDPTERVGRATVPVPKRATIASNSTRALTSIHNNVAVRAAPMMVSPPQSTRGVPQSPGPARSAPRSPGPARGAPQSPGPARGSPAARVRPPMTTSPPWSPLMTLSSSQKVIGAVRPPSVERVDVMQPDFTSGMWTPSSLHSTQTALQETQSVPVPVPPINLSSTVRSQYGSPNLSTRRGYAASMGGRAMYDIRSNTDGSTVTEKNEDTIIMQPGKNHYHWEAGEGSV